MNAQAWNCGGGTQSAAIAELIVQGKLPKPDYALMIDTEREKSSTWRYVYGEIQPRLAAVGVDLVVIPKSQYATVDLFALNGDLLLPVYTSGGTGKLPSFCSNEWKARVASRWLRDQGEKTADITTWIGYSIDELKRIRAGRHRYPLVYEYPMRRSDCVSYLVERGWPAPPPGGSACWMCPNMSDREWMNLRDNEPADFEKACALDADIRLRDPNVYLHRSGQPLTQIAASIGATDQLSLPGCDSGYCYV